jgi:hydrogenase maturation protease
LKRTLVVGFGNLYRRDDGVGPAVVNALRARQGRPPIDPEDDGFDDLGQPLDSVILHQLVPELAETAAGYDLIVFVDAHVGSWPEALHIEHLEACYKAPLVSHHIHPCTILQLAQTLTGAARPAGVVLSIRGYDFDFGEGLSAETAAGVPQAVAHILEWAEAKASRDNAQHGFDQCAAP